jgi:hypothetical protein
MARFLYPAVFEVEPTRVFSIPERPRRGDDPVSSVDTGTKMTIRRGDAWGRGSR